MSKKYFKALAVHSASGASHLSLQQLHGVKDLRRGACKGARKGCALLILREKCMKLITKAFSLLITLPQGLLT